MHYEALSQDTAGLQRIFVALGLAEPGEPIAAVALPGGGASGIYRVDLPTGRYCVKQARPAHDGPGAGAALAERVFQEVAWLQVAARIVPGHVPRVLGQDPVSKSFVMEFLGGDHLHWKSELLAGRIDASVARSLGDLVGRLHAATADDESLAQRFASDDSFRAFRLEPCLVEAARAHPALARALAETTERTARTRRVLVHGGISPENTLVGPAGPVLLDAKSAWFGDPAFDVAFCLDHLLLKAAHMPARKSELLAAFAAFAQGYRANVTWEPLAALESRVARLLPALALGRIDGPARVDYLGDARRDAVRKVASALVAQGPDRLENIVVRWQAAF